jgi:hypothetical protein
LKRSKRRQPTLVARYPQQIEKVGEMSEATVDVLNPDPPRSKPRLVQPTLTAQIGEQPLLSVGLAGLVGFIFGGGASSRTGAALLMMVARISLRRAATEAIAKAMTSYGSDKRNGSR